MELKQFPAKAKAPLTRGLIFRNYERDEDLKFDRHPVAFDADPADGVIQPFFRQLPS
jgi:hypothetical protein